MLRPTWLPGFFLAAALLALAAAAGEAPAEAVRRALQMAREPSSPDRSAASPAVAAALMDELAPEDLEQRITERPELIPGLFGTLGDALIRGDEALAARLGGYVAATTRARGRRLSLRDEGWTQDDVDLLLALQLVDPGRFVAEPQFRERVLTLLPEALDPAVPAALRDRLLYRLNQVRGVGFEAFEDVAWAWGALARRSRERELRGDAVLALGEPEEPIRASVYSLPAGLFTAPEASRFLAAVRRAAPRRTLLVLSGQPLHAALAARGAELDLRLIETWGFPYSPWPRDPLTFLDAGDGKKVALLRPPSARQGRPEDSWLGRTLVQGLPADLDAAWELRWRRAAFPFHNGHILDAAGRLWISLHTLEPRILEILGLERVPVGRFAAPEGGRYVAAAHRAAAELGALYGREVTFVHPLPAADGDPQARAAALGRLGGGAGFDLDSLLTLLDAADGGLAALVADPAAGAELVDAADATDLDRFATAYGLVARGEELRSRLLAAQRASRASHLAVFLDLVAGHLKRDAEVRRLPLLLLPRELLRDRGDADDPEFLIGWNNVVLERLEGGARAEGFASLLASGDARARAVFAEYGYRLDLFPPLVESVLRNGGYRCASQHVRGTLTPRPPLPEGEGE